MKIIKRIKSDKIAFDKSFDISNEWISGTELCHHTGFEVMFEGDDTFWYEYVDSNGNLHYGR